MSFGLQILLTVIVFQQIIVKIVTMWTLADNEYEGTRGDFLFDLCIPFSEVFRFISKCKKRFDEL